MALLLFLVFTYLYEQSRQPISAPGNWPGRRTRCTIALDAWNTYHGPSAWLFLASSLLLVAMALCIFVSTRLMREPFRLHWYDVAIGVAGIGLTLWNLRSHMVQGVFQHDMAVVPHLRLELGTGGDAAVLLVPFLPLRAPAQFAGIPHAGNLAGAVGRADGAGPVPSVRILEVLGDAGHFLGPIPQMLLGIAMVMVLFENERNAVQENALAFSTLGVDPRRLLSADDLVPSMQGISGPAGGAPADPPRRHLHLRAVAGSLALGAEGFLAGVYRETGKDRAGDYICELAYRRGGFVTFRNVPR